MADHFYSMKKPQVGNMDLNKITIDTSTTAGSDLELRVEDGAVTRYQVVQFCQRMIDYFNNKAGVAGLTG